MTEDKEQKNLPAEIHEDLKRMENDDPSLFEKLKDFAQLSLHDVENASQVVQDKTRKLADDLYNHPSLDKYPRVRESISGGKDVGGKVLKCVALITFFKPLSVILIAKLVGVGVLTGAALGKESKILTRLAGVFSKSSQTLQDTGTPNKEVSPDDAKAPDDPNLGL